ncbi:endoglucanase [Thermococcus sp. M36]|uniref:GH12 family glycosyl hydrolase domain-containing protein n=1 Tax=Thermococcus sp. M36 TaxID=1638261 RepID=UPI00143A4DFC|nr:endoglucanase [Thermococcus sp. M36]NJE05316.1 endoglucanase [Thermococcus sp. M36]
MRIKPLLVILVVLSALLLGCLREGETIVLTEPGSNRRIDYNGTELIMELNFWNIKTFNGSAEMIYYKSNHTIRFYANLSDIVMKEPQHYVHGYPEVIYGYKPWTGHGTTGKLPEKVRDIGSFRITLEYFLWHERDLPINLAMETWITSEKKAEGVKEGDVELMVWLYSNSLLRPAGSEIKTIQVPMIVNGTLMEAEWEVWLYCNAFPWDLITFRLTEPIKSAKVELDIVPFLSAAEEVFEENPCRVKSFGELYLEDWEIGTEFGSPYKRSASFEWWIYEFDVKMRGGNEPP